jgi:tRNA 2-thiouridine synthesizing protein C
MAAGARKKIMIVNRKAPHGSIYALESLEVALIAAAFNQEISLAFLDDGVFQLLKEQNTQGVQTRNFTRAFRALPDHDIHLIYVERESLAVRGLNESDLMLPVQILSAAELAARMGEQQLILSA